MRHLADVLDQFNRRGIAVILVHHTSEHEFSTKPMGNTAISAMARWCVRFERRGDRLVLRQHGNYGAESETVASAPDGTIGFQLLGETGADDLAERRTARKRQRSKETADRNKEIAGWWLANCQGMPQREAGKLIAGRFGGSPATQARMISQVYRACRARDSVTAFPLIDEFVPHPSTQ